ncbi:MAG: glycosyltransferase [Treponema sp.]|nr:glycosyltransferase [Treponema sp.]
MKKIYILSLCLDAGGVEKCVCLLANAFSKRGYIVTVANLFESKPIVPFEENVKLEQITKFHTDRLKKHSLLYRFIRKYYSFLFLILYIMKLKDSIVISTRNEYSVLLSKFGRKSLLKIAQLHNDHHFNKKLIKDFKYHYSNIDYFVHLTEKSCREIKSVMSPFNDHTKLVSIPNFVENYDYKECEKENYVISVGRFSPEKGFPRLIDVWNNIADKNKDWKLVLIGDGPERKSILKKVNDYHLQDSVVLPGFLPNTQVFEYMRKSRIYALTSYEESFSFTLVEAMQNKLALIAFDVRTGPGALIKDGFNGYLINDGNIEAYAEKLGSMMNETSLLNFLAKNSLSESEKYLEENIIPKWEGVFENFMY